MARVIIFSVEYIGQAVELIELTRYNIYSDAMLRKSVQRSRVKRVQDTTLR